MVFRDKYIDKIQFCSMKIQRKNIFLQLFSIISVKNLLLAAGDFFEILHVKSYIYSRKIDDSWKFLLKFEVFKPKSEN